MDLSGSGYLCEMKREVEDIAYTLEKFTDCLQKGHEVKITEIRERHSHILLMGNLTIKTLKLFANSLH